MRNLALFLAAALLCSLKAFAADGIAVSTAFTYAGQQIAGGGWRGSIVRFDIANNRTVKCDTLHHSREGVAHCPCISFDGTKVCFFRDGDRYDNGTLAPAASDYISVMNIDGSDKKNIVEFTGAEAKNQFYKSGYDRLMDWPVGDWIYYTQPQTSKVWRVNYKTLAKEYLVDYHVDPFMRRWNMSADGTRAACTNGSLCSTFPDLKNKSTDAGGCNLTLSASGRFTAFFGWRPCRRYDEDIPEAWKDPPGHTHISFGDWNWKTGYVNRDIGYCKNDYVNYTIAARFAGRDSIGRGGEIIRWSVNSDKWVMHHIGWKSYAAQTSRWGSNMVIYNWADLETIMASNNPPCNDNTDHHRIFCNMAGDFWIKPPKDEYINTHFESIYGTWLPLGTYPEGPLPEYNPIPYDKAFSGVAAVHEQKSGQCQNAGSISLTRNAHSYTLHFRAIDAQRIKMYSVSGKLISEISARNNEATVPSSIRGAYIISLESNNDILKRSKLIF